MRKGTKQEVLIWLHGPLPSNLVEECKVLSYFLGRGPEGYNDPCMWPRIIKGYVNGPLAVHRDARRRSKWRITHRLSGLNVSMTAFPSKKAAVRIRDRILELTATTDHMTWDLTYAEFNGRCPADKNILSKIVCQSVKEILGDD
jgi:hypothetical protein